MKTLSREGIQRMFEGSGAGSGSGGGISSRDLAGLATQMWVNQNYLSIEFFSSLFKAYAPAETTGDPDVEVTPNGGDTSTITNIKAMFGFWTEQYISALGQGSGGGGGGATTLGDLLDVEFSGTPSDGQVLKYNGTTHKWYNSSIQGGSTAWSDITNKPTTIAGYGITDAKIVNGTITLGSNSITPLTSSSLVGYATQSWVQQQGYLTSSSLSGYATQYWVNNQGFLTSSDISDMATKTWVGNQGYLTSSAISDMATKTWVGNQGYLTSSSSLDATKLTGSIAFARLPTMYWADVAVSNSSNNNTSPQFGSLRLKPGSANYGGYLYFGDGTYAYICEPTDDSLQYKVGTSKTHIFTVGSTNRMEVNNSGLTVNGGLSITGFIDGATNIELKGSGNGGYIDFHYNQSSSDYTSRIIEESSGTVKLYGNFVASGGVTALSDARLKDITGDTDVSVEQIASMPSVYYRWKKGDKYLHVGSIAQDWQKLLPEVVETNVDKEGNLSLNYGVAALISAITTARKVVDHEQRIIEIERILNNMEL